MIGMSTRAEWVGFEAVMELKMHMCFCYFPPVDIVTILCGGPIQHFCELTLLIN